MHTIPTWVTVVDGLIRSFWIIHLKCKVTPSPSCQVAGGAFVAGMEAAIAGGDAWCFSPGTMWGQRCILLLVRVCSGSRVLGAIASSEGWLSLCSNCRKTKDFIITSLTLCIYLSTAMSWG